MQLNTGTRASNHSKYYTWIKPSSHTLSFQRLMNFTLLRRTHNSELLSPTTSLHFTSLYFTSLYFTSLLSTLHTAPVSQSFNCLDLLVLFSLCSLRTDHAQKTKFHYCLAPTAENISRGFYQRVYWRADCCLTTSY
jgi:hypothetical protein